MKKKLFIQIPCLNEEKSISAVICEIPVSKLTKLALDVKIVVIDDCSSDKTAFVAKKSGADFIIHNNTNLGLAKSFRKGLDFCVKQGADIIVNTDGDNQYTQGEIVKIVKPILDGRADMVIGDRLVETLDFMPVGNKIGNRVGSLMIRFLTGREVSDASSGFRAFSRDLATRFNLQSNHTYTHETIIQAANMDALIMNIPITFKKRKYGKSRLISNLFGHIQRSVVTIGRSVLVYKAFPYLFSLGLVISGIGILGVFRFLYFFSIGNGTGHVQSLVISSVLINLGFVIIVLGVIADLISINRKTLEEIRSTLKIRS